MKIKLSKSQWEMIGKKASWIKKIAYEQNTPTVQKIKQSEGDLKLLNEVLDTIIKNKPLLGSQVVIDTFLFDYAKDNVALEQIITGLQKDLETITKLQQDKRWAYNGDEGETEDVGYFNLVMRHIDSFAEDAGYLYDVALGNTNKHRELERVWQQSYLSQDQNNYKKQINVITNKIKELEKEKNDLIAAKTLFGN